MRSRAQAHPFVPWLWHDLARKFSAAAEEAIPLFWRFVVEKYGIHPQSP